MSVNETNKYKISSLKDCGFQSKLFIDLNSTDEQSFNNSFEDESDKCSEIDDINNGCFLIKELIDELDSPTSDFIKEENTLNHCNSKSPLINNGYDFLPKRYRNRTNKNYNNKKKKINKYNINFNEDNSNKINYYDGKFTFKKDRKGDWFCKLCYNLNFGFRKKCNRCKVPKEECIKN